MLELSLRDRNGEVEFLSGQPTVIFLIRLGVFHFLLIKIISRKLLLIKIIGSYWKQTLS